MTTKYKYGYAGALEAAGAKIVKFKEYGDYLGVWVARIESETGQDEYISADYGSCSGCDSFEDEFAWDADKLPGYNERLKLFGKGYLDTAQSRELFKKNIEEWVTKGWGSVYEEILKDLNSGAL